MSELVKNNVLSSTFFSELKEEHLFDVSDTQKNYRQSNWESLQKLEFPTTRDEYWKYTRLGKVVKTVYQNPTKTSKSLSITDVEGFTGTRLVFENGIFRNDLSTIINEAIKVLPLSQAKMEYGSLVDQYLGKQTNCKSHVFSAINGYYHQDGLFVYIPKNQKPSQPIELINYGSGSDQLINLRNLFVLENGAEAELFIREINQEKISNLFNTTAEVFVADNAHFKSYQHQTFLAANQVQTADALVGKNATYKNWLFTQNGQLVRNNHNAKFDGENAATEIFGIYLPKENSLVDNHTYIDHALPNCYSNELYRGIISDQATAVFNGKVMVRQHAQKTNAFQANNNILLSDKGTVNSKPELEIYADDVKCSHGSTTGQMDEEALFYLRSRGVSKESAINLMVQAFAHSVLENLPNEPIKNYFNQILENRFS